MERTTLSSPAQFETILPKTFSFETVPDSPVYLGGGIGPGFEISETAFTVNVFAKRFHSENEEVVAVQLWITPVQLAELVKAYFAEMICNSPKIYRQLLERLLRRRWTVMSFKSTRKDGNLIQPYHKVN